MIPDDIGELTGARQTCPPVHGITRRLDYQITRFPDY